jgi:ADP-ribose pyrophosphatase YjhB (NUDIX family)
MNTQVKVAVVVVNKEGKALLIKEKLQKKPVALWNIIKGSYDGGETILEAAKRECREEASIDVTLTHSLGVYISEEPGKIRVQFNFLAQADNEDIALASREEQESRDEAIEEVQWTTKEEIQSMKEDSFVSQRAQELLKDWMTDKKFPLEAYKQVNM